MSSKNLVLVLTASVLLLAGCGRHYSGVYRGKESISQTQLGAQQAPVISDLTLTLNQSGGDSVQGTWISTQGGSGTLTAQSTTDGLTGVQLTLAAGTYQGTYYNYWNTAGCQQTYTGTLSSPNSNQLTGILVSTGSCYTTYGGAGSRTIDVSK